MNYKYWCTDCKCFVEKNHRCQQWETVFTMPEEAFQKLESQNKRMREAIKEALTLFRKWGDSQALEVLDEALKEVDDEAV